jgi:spore coat protein U-like protein
MLLGRVCAGAAALGALMSSPAAAQDTASAQGQVAIHEPMTVFAVQDMDFGQIVTRGPAGTVTIVPNPTQTCTVTGTLTRTGPCRAAVFSGYAGLLSTIRVSRMPGNLLLLTGPGGATMTVTNLTYTSDATMIAWGSGPTYVQYLVVAGDGMYLFRVGGRLNVGAYQAPGVYNGTINVWLNYN